MHRLNAKNELKLTLAGRSFLCFTSFYYLLKINSNVSRNRNLMRLTETKVDTKWTEMNMTGLTL